jgi:hypothetical protein
MPFTIKCSVRRAPAVRTHHRGARPGERSSMSDPTFGAAARPDIPGAKLCECGCGQPTRIAKANDPRHGHVKGQGVRFLKGHSHRGKVVSAETRARLGAANSGSANHGWRGDDASYRALHGYLCKHYPKAGVCEECGERKPTDYALIHGRTYSRNREDYRELCRRCHLRYDLGGVKKSPEAIARITAGLHRRWDLDKAQGRKRHGPRGEDFPHAKLTESAVIQIRRLRAQGSSPARLASEYGVSPRTIRDAVSGRTWAHVTETAGTEERAP